MQVYMTSGIMLLPPSPKQGGYVVHDKMSNASPNLRIIDEQDTAVPFRHIIGSIP